MARSIIRPLVLAAVLLFAGLALWFAPSGEPNPSTERLTWVAEAHQFGPVGYRDPAGAISPDGRWIAYSEGRFLRVRAAAGGPLVDLPDGEAQIRNIAWSPDSRSILADGFQTQSGWALYDRVDGTRRPLWSDRDPLGRREGRPTCGSRRGRPTAARSPRLSTAAMDRICGPLPLTDRRRTRSAWRIASPFRPGRRADEIACVTTTDGRMRLTIPCGGDHIVKTDPDLDVYGPVAFSPDARDRVSVVRERLRHARSVVRARRREAARAA